MMTISEILDAAKERGGYTSYNQLAKAIDGDPTSLVRYRKGHALPSEETMLRLCELAGIDVEEGLLMLNVWRSEGTAKDTYLSLLKRIAAAFPSGLLMAAQMNETPSEAPPAPKRSNAAKKLAVAFAALAFTLPQISETARASTPYAVNSSAPAWQDQYYGKSRDRKARHKKRPRRDAGIIRLLSMLAHRLQGSLLGVGRGAETRQR